MERNLSWEANSYTAGQNIPHQAGWSSDNALELYSGGILFESLPRHELTEFFIDFFRLKTGGSLDHSFQVTEMMFCDYCFA